MVEYILRKIVRHLPDQEKSPALIDIKAQVATVLTKVR